MKDSRCINGAQEIKIKTNLNITKEELNLYLKDLQLKYDVPPKYVQDNSLLQKTKNKEVIINHKTFKIDLPNIWKLKESSNTEYQIHTLNQIIQSQISLFIYKEYDVNIIKWCIQAIENWFDNNEKIELLKWYSYAKDGNWQDMATSYRLGNILLVYELALKFNVDINKERFRREILHHIDWLKQHVSHNNLTSVVSNHKLFVSRYLILGFNVFGEYFSSLDNSYIILGIDSFIDTISANVDINDGLSKEHSSNYHILYYRQLDTLLRIFYKSNENYEKLKTLSDKMYNNLNYFIYPNNHFVQIGDTDDKLSYYQFNNLEPLKTFNNVGFAIYKKDSTYLSLSCSCHSKYHKHMDELSINYFNKYPILIEGGRYSYGDHKPNNTNKFWRNSYFLSQRSKNSIVIDDNYFSFNKIVKLLNNGSYAYGSGIQESHVKDNKIILNGTNPLLAKMQNIKHNRLVSLDENQTVTIEDTLVSYDETEHKSTRHFHFHYNWELVEIVENRVIFKHKISNEMFEFTDLSCGEIKYYCGQEKPFIQGFTSDYEHHKIAIPTLEISNMFTKSTLLSCSMSVVNNKNGNKFNLQHVYK